MKESKFCIGDIVWIKEESICDDVILKLLEIPTRKVVLGERLFYRVTKKTGEVSPVNIWRVKGQRSPHTIYEEHLILIPTKQNYFNESRKPILYRFEESKYLKDERKKKLLEQKRLRESKSG